MNSAAGSGEAAEQAPSAGPKWLRINAVLAMHEEQLSEHGGAAGIRGRGLLESALARPRNLFHFENPAIPSLAAAYAAGIVRNHPFVDGNKRTGFLAMYTFLVANGFELTATEPEAVAAILALAAGELDEIQFSAWVADYAHPFTATAQSSGS